MLIKSFVRSYLAVKHTFCQRFIHRFGRVQSTSRPNRIVVFNPVDKDAVVDSTMYTEM